MLDIAETQTTPEDKALKEIDLQSKVNQFLINRDEEETKLTLDFAKALLHLELQIKELRDDQRAIRLDAKANGVAVTKVNRVLANLKKLFKTDPTDLSELESIELVLANDVDVKTMLDTLVKKD